MMFWTDEPLEGVAFDVQDHTRRTGTRGSVHMGRWSVRTSMGLKSPLDGRWDGKGRIGFVTSPCTEKKRDALIRTFWHRSWLVGISPWQMGRGPWWTGHHQWCWTTSRACGSHDGLDGHVWHVAGAPGGATFCSLDGYCALKGPTSPLRGLTSLFFCSLLAFRHVKVTND